MIHSSVCWLLCASHSPRTSNLSYVPIALLGIPVIDFLLHSMAKCASPTIASLASTSVHIGTYHQFPTPLTQHTPPSSAYIPPPPFLPYPLMQTRLSVSRATAVPRAPRAHVVLLVSLRKGRPLLALLPHPSATPHSPIYHFLLQMGHMETVFVSHTSPSKSPIIRPLAHTMLHVHHAGSR